MRIPITILLLAATNLAMEPAKPAVKDGKPVHKDATKEEKK